jgi:hypothetical protein
VLVAHVRNPSYFLIAVRSQPRQIVHKTLSQKTPSQERAGGVAQGDVLSSNPSTTKKKPQYCLPLQNVIRQSYNVWTFVFFFFIKNTVLFGVFVLFLRQGLTTLPRLAWNSPPSYHSTQTCWD